MLVEVIEWGDLVGEGLTGARFVSLRGVVKYTCEDSPYLVANEHLAARLASYVGLPVPPFALIADAQGRPGFVSLFVGRRGEPAPPVYPPHFVKDHPVLAAEVLAFDAWIRNSDRHASNIAYSRVGNVPPFIFDHERALLGCWEGRGIIELRQGRDEPCRDHCLGHLMRDEALIKYANGQIAAVPDVLIQNAVRETMRRDLITPDEARELVDFLIHRRDHLPSLVRPVLTGITQPSLFQ